MHGVPRRGLVRLRRFVFCRWLGDTATSRGDLTRFRLDVQVQNHGDGIAMDGRVLLDAWTKILGMDPMSITDCHRTIMSGLETIDVSLVLPGWARRADATRACFWKYRSPWKGVPIGEGGGEDFDKITRPEPGCWRTLVFLSYENPKGASGGILAVIRRLPAEIQRHFRDTLERSGPEPEVLRLSPLHTRLKTAFDPEQLSNGTPCVVPFDGVDVPVAIHKVTNGAGEDWHLFSAKGFFEADGWTGRTDPYIDSSEEQQMRDGDGSRLLRDSLFACRAVPVILETLKKTEDLIVHAQDWEFATAALTVKEAVIQGSLKRAAVVLTLHNPYDHILSEANLAKITARQSGWHWPEIGKMRRPTVLTRMIPLLDAPVSAVSHQFARELTEAPIQTGIFTGHQQGVLNYQGIVGIDNGDFSKGEAAPYSATAVDEARSGNPTRILGEKAAKRAVMLQALEAYLGKVDPKDTDTLTMGTLTGGEGKRLVDLPACVPVFMMIGRLDPGQKGYDVCVQLIRKLPRGCARFVLTPMSPLAKDGAVSPFFDQLEQLTNDRPGEVVVFAHKMGAAYQETQAGATFGLWPSRYEPFGGASEFYACGTPVIAHAVGGLVQQVIDHGRTPLDATGLLYFPQSCGEPREVLEAQYIAAHRAPPKPRLSVPVYKRECEALQLAVLDAIDIFQNEPEDYGRMLGNLADMLTELGWKKPVQDYLRWYDRACLQAPVDQ